MKQICQIVLLGVAMMPMVHPLCAQENEALEYRRSSLYSVLINHEEQKFASEIKTAFLTMPVPDKYNDHGLSVKMLNVDKKLSLAEDLSRANMIIGDSQNDGKLHVVDCFLRDNYIASRLLGKWFNRDLYTGQCDMELVKERGLYNASEFDKILAEKSVRGQALLTDAGEELIGRTFVLMNDIRYVDKAQTGQAIGASLRILGALASAYTGSTAYSDLGKSTGDLAETLKGFNVKINTYLYQLVWDEETAMGFYREQYSAVPDSQKCKAFHAARRNYHLRYIGKQESSGSTTSFMGIKLDEPVRMVRKACQRALDENVANLQKDFEVFKIKSPLISVEPLRAYVGLKEGITANSRFEILEPQEDAQGKRVYKQVGIVAPVASLIWDNRYMASEEGAYGADFGFTTFKKVSGADLQPGMLIRELE